LEHHVKSSSILVGRNFRHIDWSDYCKKYATLVNYLNNKSVELYITI
jgi:hypothetical protein